MSSGPVSAASRERPRRWRTGRTTAPRRGRPAPRSGHAGGHRFWFDTAGGVRAHGAQPAGQPQRSDAATGVGGGLDLGGVGHDGQRAPCTPTISGDQLPYLILRLDSTGDYSADDGSVGADQHRVAAGAAHPAADVVDLIWATGRRHRPDRSTDACCRKRYRRAVRCGHRRAGCCARLQRQDRS